MVDQLWYSGILIYEFRSDFAIEMEENWRKGRVQLGLKEGGGSGSWQMVDGKVRIATVSEKQKR